MSEFVPLNMHTSMLTISHYASLAELCIYKVLSACEEIAGMVRVQLLKTIPPPHQRTMHVIYDLDILMYLKPPSAPNMPDRGDKMVPCLFYNMTYHPKSFLKLDSLTVSDTINQTTLL